MASAHITNLKMVGGLYIRSMIIASIVCSCRPGIKRSRCECNDKSYYCSKSNYELCRMQLNNLLILIKTQPIVRVKGIEM